MSKRNRPIVALVTDAIFPYHLGGKEIRYHQLAQRLTAHADVDVYTMRWWRDRPAETVDGVRHHALSPLLPLYTGERRSILQALVFAAGCLSLLWRRFDVIEADHMPYVQLFPLRLVATLRRKRLIVTWHECWGPGYWRSYLGAAGRIGWLLERAAMRLPDAIIAASEQTAARLHAQLGSDARVTVAPNGVDLERIRAIPASGRPVDLAVVGRLLDHKRIDLLLDALAILRHEGQPLSCRVIGNGPELGALQAQAQRLGLSDRIDFRPDVPTETELFSLLKDARLFAFPSEREGFGIAVLEALACGLPVVTTSAPDNLARFLVERAEDGIVCEPTDAAMAAAIGTALATRNGHTPTEAAWLREFDWTSVTDQVAEAMLA